MLHLGTCRDPVWSVRVAGKVRVYVLQYNKRRLCFALAGQKVTGRHRQEKKIGRNG